MNIVQRTQHLLDVLFLIAKESEPENCLRADLLPEDSLIGNPLAADLLPAEPAYSCPEEEVAVYYSEAGTYPLEAQAYLKVEVASSEVAV
jgi:hypothetical protein